MCRLSGPSVNQWELKGRNNKGFKRHVVQNKNKCMGLVREWNQRETENSIQSSQEDTVQPFIHLFLSEIVL